jgi:hypothetical protein
MINVAMSRAESNADFYLAHPAEQIKNSRRIKERERIEKLWFIGQRPPAIDHDARERSTHV